MHQFSNKSYIVLNDILPLTPLQRSSLYGNVIELLLEIQQKELITVNNEDTEHYIICLIQNNT